MTEVIMPKMGDGMEEGTLIEWLKKEGEKVKSGEVIGTIQTDKATLELEAPGSGILQGILIQGGETVPVGRPIAALLKEGETLPSGWGSGVAASPPVPAEAAPALEATEVREVIPVAAGSDRIKSSPLARKVAAAKGVDLRAISGSGPGGRVVLKDVEAAASSPRAATPVAVPGPRTSRKVSMNRLRQITAKRTQESKQQVPHFYVTVEIDLERVAALRAQFEEEQSGKVSVNDFIVKATALALRDMPEVNASFEDGSLMHHDHVSIGVAVALEDGLTVPVIHDADALSVRQIGARSKELAARARDNKLGLEELTGSTFSISNMGMLNVDGFAAIINQPNSGILAVGTASRRVVVTEGDEIDIRLRMNVTGSFDHRVVDGAVGARFMNLIRDYLENPTRLLG